MKRNAAVTMTDKAPRETPLSKDLSAQKMQGEQEPGLPERWRRTFQAKGDYKDP